MASQNLRYIVSVTSVPSPLQAQKLILDTELDIIAKQNEGADTTGLRQRVAALKLRVYLSFNMC